MVGLHKSARAIFKITLIFISLRDENLTKFSPRIFPKQAVLESKTCVSLFLRLRPIRSLVLHTKYNKIRHLFLRRTKEWPPIKPRKLANTSSFLLLERNASENFELCRLVQFFGKLRDLCWSKVMRGNSGQSSGLFKFKQPQCSNYLLKKFETVVADTTRFILFVTKK